MIRNLAWTGIDKSSIQFEWTCHCAIAIAKKCVNSPMEWYISIFSSDKMHTETRDPLCVFMYINIYPNHCYLYTLVFLSRLDIHLGRFVWIHFIRANINGMQLFAQIIFWFLFVCCYWLNTVPKCNWDFFYGRKLYKIQIVDYIRKSAIKWWLQSMYSRYIIHIFNGCFASACRMDTCMTVAICPKPN